MAFAYLVLGLYAVSTVSGLPTTALVEPTDCIQMTPEINQQIDTIVEKFADFLESITEFHPNIDIGHIQLSIEPHFDDEEEEDTVLELQVNDCSTGSKDVEKKSGNVKTDPRVFDGKDSTPKDNNKQVEKQSDVKNDSASKDSKPKTPDAKLPKSSSQSIEVKSHENNKTEKLKCSGKEYSVDCKESEDHPEVMSLNLPPNGEEALQFFQKNRTSPIVLFVQQNSNQTEYTLLK